jgi:hypothetical protein
MSQPSLPHENTKFCVIFPYFVSMVTRTVETPWNVPVATLKN